MTFDLLQQAYRKTEYDWKHYYEAFCVCRQCRKSTVFLISLKRIGDTEFFKQLPAVDIVANNIANVEEFVSLKDEGGMEPPEHLPPAIEAAFIEGATCLAVKCHNAAGCMFRLCLDFATKSRLPPEGTEGISAKQRRDLGLRLPWLFDHGLLPESLRALSKCIREDGNDGAHAGTLSPEDAEDIQDFTFELLDRLFTEPKRIELAETRRTERRTKRRD